MESILLNALSKVANDQGSQETSHAVFTLAPVDDEHYAATTRAADRGEEGRIGLPGGKVDEGESPIEALLREAAEEGWALDGVTENPIHTQLVDGKLVHWYQASSAKQLDEYKEKGRITPIPATASQLHSSGYGNENLNLAQGES